MLQRVQNDDRRLQQNGCKSELRHMLKTLNKKRILYKVREVRTNSKNRTSAIYKVATV
jgi:hypothetical protein